MKKVALIPAALAAVVAPGSVQPASAAIQKPLYTVGCYYVTIDTPRSFPEGTYEDWRVELEDGTVIAERFGSRVPVLSLSSWRDVRYHGGQLENDLLGSRQTEGLHEIKVWHGWKNAYETVPMRPVASAILPCGSFSNNLSIFALPGVGITRSLLPEASVATYEISPGAAAPTAEQNAAYEALTMRLNGRNATPNAAVAPVSAPAAAAVAPVIPLTVSIIAPVPWKVLIEPVAPSGKDLGTKTVVRGPVTCRKGKVRLKRSVNFSVGNNGQRVRTISYACVGK